jgi:hypothetical protein
MVPAAARAGMLSAAILLAPGCGAPSTPTPSREEPLRRAAFRTLAARDYLLSCPAAGSRAEIVYQMNRAEELKALAVRKGAGRAMALGENDWNAVSRYDERERCETGEAPFNEALAAFDVTLDTLAERIAEYRP